MCTLILIHGFLGLPEDWDASIPDNTQRVRVSLFSEKEPLSKSLMTFEGPANQINQIALQYPPPRIIVGYSLGGRIALKAITQNNAPIDLWKGAAIISAHPGLIDLLEKKARIHSDETWAQRFESESWKTVLSSWNEQSVLKNTESESNRNELNRDESHFSRRLLAEALRGCSLGQQEDFSYQLSKIQIPIFWIVGELDPKFKAIGTKIKQVNPLIELHSIPKSGHRVLQDQPKALKKIIQTLMTRCHG